MLLFAPFCSEIPSMYPELAYGIETLASCYQNLDQHNASLCDSSVQYAEGILLFDKPHIDFHFTSPPLGLTDPLGQ